LCFQFNQSSFSPIPEAILDDFGRVECASFMGLLPEVHRAWISVDNRLYLWDYERRDAFTLYDGLSDVIFSVALAAPRPGIFTDFVKYVLVVATSVEVVLLAVTWKESSGGMEELRLQSTQYAISTDNSTIFKIACSSKGRIFLAGNDRNLYEMVYENDKDSWKSYLGLETPFKCRKVSHSGWSLVNLLDPVLRALGGAEDGLVDLTVDDSRNILYGVSAGGKLSVFSLGMDGLGLSRAAADFDVITCVQDYFSSRAPTSRNSPLLDSSALRVASIHVVEPSEARDVHLVVVMTSGVRVYVALATTYGKPVVNGFDMQQCVIQILGIRAPPTPKMINELSVDPDSSNNRVGAPNGSMQVNNALYSHRAFVTAVNNPLNSSDVLVGVAEDFVRRKTSSSIGIDDSAAFKEGYCIIECSPLPGRVHEIREICPHIKDPFISALRVSYGTVMCRSDPSKDVVGSAAATAQVLDPITPDLQLPLGPPFGLPHAGWGLHDKRSGLTKAEIDSGAVATLGETALQHGPSEAYMQRKFVCLSNVGLHVVAKVRPVDYLFSLLTRSNTSGSFPVDYLPEVGAFFDACGTLGAATMCIGLACGLPLDAGGDTMSLSDTVGVSASGMALLQRRAISAVLRFTDGPTCVQSALLSTARPQFGDSVAPVLTDSRVVAGDVSVVYSSCHDALYLFASRLLRSVWNKVIVTDRSANKKVSAKTPTVLIWKEQLHAVIEPLTFFIKILKEYFGPTLAAAESALCGSAASATATSLESLNETKPGVLVSRQLSRAAAAAASRGGAGVPNTDSGASKPEQLDIHARKEEDASILHLYRLMCRSLQALQLMSILLTLPEDYNISTPWDYLKDLTFSSIVLSASAQDSVKSLIQSVLSRLPSGGVEPILALVDNHCYMYFSVGDRLSLEASRMLDAASQLSDSETKQRTSLVSSAINKLLQACVYWQSRASLEGESSTLGQAIGKLGALGGPLALDGIVDIGLRTADNFKRTSRDLKPLDRQSSTATFSGDR
jgi:nuclear pore complex protein Nup155